MASFFFALFLHYVFFSENNDIYLGGDNAITKFKIMKVQHFQATSGNTEESKSLPIGKPHFKASECDVEVEFKSPTETVIDVIYEDNTWFTFTTTDCNVEIAQELGLDVYEPKLQQVAYGGGRSEDYISDEPTLIEGEEADSYHFGTVELLTYLQRKGAATFEPYANDSISKVLDCLNPSI